MTEFFLVLAWLLAVWFCLYGFRTVIIPVSVFLSRLKSRVSIEKCVCGKPGHHPFRLDPVQLAQFRGYSPDDIICFQQALDSLASDEEWYPGEFREAHGWVAAGKPDRDIAGEER